MEKLSACVLTLDNAETLRNTLEPLVRVADEVLVLDSGSTDGTLEVAAEFGCRVVQSSLAGFGEQRNRGQALASFDHVLFIDSDETMDEQLVAAILALKRDGFGHDAYALRRDWLVLGRPVRAFYPIRCPDFPVRLLDRRRVSWNRGVHEYPSGYRSSAVLPGRIVHDTYRSEAEIAFKLAKYSALAAADLLAKQGPPGRLAGPLHAAGAFLQWYVLKGNWRDGRVGLTAALFAARFTSRKYRIARLTSATRSRLPRA